MNLVSIILPTYNGEKYIKESIDSVINQTYTNWELIIVNDCSKDNTLNIVNEYAQKDKRIRVVSNKSNLKLPASLNVGFSHAKGQYFTWTSDDNLYKPEAIEYMATYLDNNKDVDMISCDCDLINDEGKLTGKLSDIYGEKYVCDLALHNNIGACFMYRSSIATKTGCYDVNTFCAEDYDYWCRIALNGNIYFSNNNLYKYRQHEGSLTTQKIDEAIKKTIEIQNRYSSEIIRKYIVSKKTQAKKYLKLYENTMIKKWLDEAFKVHPIYMYKYKLKKILSHVFSVKKKQDKYVVLLIGLKISVKIKNTPAKLLIKKYNKAKGWIEKYTVNNNGIVVESNQPKTIYPECSGYYIPTLLRFGDKERAVNFGNYLITIQNDDGSWNEPSGKTPYTFDTAQILKGLVALIEYGLDKKDKYKKALLKGCDYIVSMQRQNGSIATADYNAWGLPYGKRVPEYIHVYCLEPLRKTGQMYNIKKYEDCVSKALNFYLAQEDLTDFMTLSHFNAYVIEGLIDLGETKRAKRAMDLISLHQRENGMVPAYSFVDFVCSTGLFQYAICWYKLGEIEKADKAFDYACSLQNKSGGFFGSYTVGKDKANYFPTGEIDWAVKYFLDAIWYGKKDNLINIKKENKD